MQRPRSWWPDLGFLAAFVALTWLLAAGHLLDLDIAVADWTVDHQPAAIYWTARVLNYLGQGGQVLMPVALLLAGLLAWRAKSIRPFLVFAGGFLITYVTIGPLKIWLQRAAPRFEGPDRVILFNDAATGIYGMSYPSGHVANALVWYGVIGFLVARLTTREIPWWLLRVVPPAIVFCTTTYLTFHWITDSIAGLFLGLVLTRVMARIPWDTLPVPFIKEKASAPHA